MVEQLAPTLQIPVQVWAGLPLMTVLEEQLTQEVCRLKDIIAELNVRAQKHTQCMLAKQVEYLDRARRAESKLNKLNGSVYEKERG